MRALLLILFLLSTGIFALLLNNSSASRPPVIAIPKVIGTPRPGQPQPTATPTTNSDTGSAIGLTLSGLTSLLTLAGLVSMLVIDWRKESREAQKAQLEIERQRLEIERQRVELERAKRNTP